MIKKRAALLIVLLLLCTLGGFAQTTATDTSAYKQSLQFLQGDGVFESGPMAFLTGLKDSIWTHFDLFITDAKALAAIFMIIFLLYVSVLSMIYRIYEKKTLLFS